MAIYLEIERRTKKSGAFKQLILEIEVDGRIHFLSLLSWFSGSYWGQESSFD